MRRVYHFLEYLYYYVFGHICWLLNFHKRKKYLKGKWFRGFKAEGWMWLCKDTAGCILNRINRSVPWPVASNIKISFPENIIFDVDDLNNFQATGSYFQAFDKIIIGKGTFISFNVGLITANHDFSNLENHQESRPIIIGEKCWIGMNSVILPGVTLGTRTIVGAGSVVTKSFPEGNCVVAGNPAKKIKDL